MTRRSDGEEEVALVDVANAAASSLFSPNMWVCRPSRTPRAYRMDEGEPNTERSPGAGQPLRDTTNITAHLPPIPPSSRQKRRQREDQQDLSYLEAPDREGAEKEQIEADLAHIAVIEREIMYAQQTSRELQKEYQDIASELKTVHAQNSGVKRMFAALGVAKDDFNMAGAVDEPSRKRRMIEIGQKLVISLNEPKPEEQRQKPMPPQPPRRGRPPLNPVAHTPAPTIAGSACPIFTPPASFPMESQIAAASLTLSKGDAAVALLSLLEKALAARAPPAQMPPPLSFADAAGGSAEEQEGSLKPLVLEPVNLDIN
ncbi:hypothetical protein Ndes2526B_g07251 [Nannochloris sp. 'desiccata']|nr:hypothetical protein KSW81_004724 [Chlorella desiccata (nom. nud.)]KAH7618317.1 hypothetical protein NADE_000512 [Chlorella desiccata (nom. nud.)]